MRQDGRVALGLLCGLVEQIAALRADGLEVLVVSSGAVGLGMERLGLMERPTAIAQIQACAANGQSRLMALYDDAFARMNSPIAQVLLTEDDFRDPERHANLRATLDALLMKHIDADLLVLLSDVDGLYDKPPQEAGARVIARVEEIDEHVLALADGGNGRGRGGMASKLESARIVLRAGKQVVIANGRTPQVLERIIAGEQLGTRFATALEETAQ